MLIVSTCEFEHCVTFMITFQIEQVTKCWNSNVHALNSYKYKCLAKLQHASLVETLTKLVTAMKQNI